MPNIDPTEMSHEKDLEACCAAARRYIKSRVFSPDAEDLAQITCMRVWKRVQRGGIDIKPQYCIGFAKKVMQEYWVKTGKIKPLEQDEEINLVEEEEDDAKGYDARSRRAECQAECLEGLDKEKLVLLWRFCYKDRFELIEGETHNSSTDFLLFLGPAIARIRKLFSSVQNENEPLSTEEKKKKRLRVFQIRVKLRKCMEACMKENVPA